MNNNTEIQSSLVNIVFSTLIIYKNYKNAFWIYILHNVCKKKLNNEEKNKIQRTGMVFFLFIYNLSVKGNLNKMYSGLWKNNAEIWYTLTTFKCSMLFPSFFLRVEYHLHFHSRSIYWTPARSLGYIRYWEKYLL